MVALLKVAASVGWSIVNKYYGTVMRFIGEGWTVNQIVDWLKRHM